MVWSRKRQKTSGLDVQRVSENPVLIRHRRFLDTELVELAFLVLGINGE